MNHSSSLSFFYILLLALLPIRTSAQQLTLSQPHGIYDSPFTLAVEWKGEAVIGTTIRYTLDGSEPTKSSKAYTAPLDVSGNTIMRAAAVADTGLVTPIVTATYLFIDDILRQPNNPKGYPDTWGQYTQTWGTAIADYEMDPEMTNDATLRPRIAAGLQQLAVLSIVTDKDNLFSHENDSVRGGIYIFTGPPVGDNTGHGWTRPASVELFTPDGHEAGFSVNCGLRLHGGHGRLAEKNPKHSFRLVFKEKYGPKTLQYPLFGDDEPSKFDQLVLRCHFGNSWQHWSEGNREKAQYTRDVWARRMQRRMGHTSVNARYVHLFLNGMYWGLYNMSERVDDQFGKDHLGGKKSDIDVVKIEEDGGNHHEAAEGDLDAWNLMIETAAEVGNSPADDDTAYYRLQGMNADGDDDPQLEALLDVDNFIDYMLINQYGGNTDWDHHNWYALRRRGAESQGFRFLCWDSEILLESSRENNLSKNNGKRYPTGIFHNLLKNEKFARRYMRRAKNVLADDGPLGQQSVVELWDSLYNTISEALYAEAARWGDYRRDVHPYQTRGKLYTVDGTYMTERSRLLNDYFPTRTETVLSQIIKFLNIDDFEVPAEWHKLTAAMFHEWDGTGVDAKPTGNNVNVDWNMGVNAAGGSAVAGFVGVEYNRYADLSSYNDLVIRGTGNKLRILANRLVDHGPWKEITVNFNDSDPYWNADLGAIVLPLDDLKNAPTNVGATRNDNFLHLNAMKVNWDATVNVSAVYLTPGKQQMVVTGIKNNSIAKRTYYNLNGQRVQTPGKGIYVVGGKKFVVDRR